MADRKIEILSPAGSYAAFEAALKAGADAVYIGGAKFGARAYAENFAEEELIQAIREAHFYERKLYLTVNTLLKEEEIDSLYDYLAPCYENGLDAVIVQDMGVAGYIRRYFPGLDIHASTQMTITGALGARFVESRGITRVVPARELSLEEIRQIRRETDLEIECFVHGALCYCYSGQCLLSSMIGGRSGNRGQCAQPCRLPYTFDEKKKYYLSPKDICTLEIIPDLIEAGIDSFKIEGRMKKPEYVAGVTSLYRKYTDIYLDTGGKDFHILPEDREMLMDLYNRGGSSTGYFQMRNGREMMSLDRPNHAGVPAVKVQYQKGREVHALAVTDMNAGDVLEITGGKNNYTLGKPVKNGDSVTFLIQKQIRLPKGQLLNRIRNESLLHCIDTDIIGKNLQRPADGELTLKTGTPARLRVCSGGVAFQALTDEPVQPALSRPMAQERICSQIRKTGNSEFYFKDLSVEMDDNIFIPVGQLNLLRRRALDGLKEKLLSRHLREPVNVPPESDHKNDPDTARSFNKNLKSNTRHADPVNWIPHFSIYVESTEQFKAAVSYISEKQFVPVRMYLGTDIQTTLLKEDESGQIYEALCLVRKNNIEIVPAMPHILRSTETSSAGNLLNAADKYSPDGILIRNCEEFQLLRERGFDKKIILDHNLYVFNRYAKKFWNELGISDFTAPLELNAGELSQLRLNDCELEIYGRAPVMVSAQCLFKTSGKCLKQSHVSCITDRCSSRFPVRAYCDFCYNVIYNDRPTCLAADADIKEIFRLRPRFLRIRFSTETADQVKEVLSMVQNSFIESTDTSGYDSYGERHRFTQGHFRKGIL